MTTWAFIGLYMLVGWLSLARASRRGWTESTDEAAAYFWLWPACFLWELSRRAGGKKS